MKSFKALASLTAVAALALSACGSSDSSDSSGGSTKIVVGASPVPHAELLEHIKDRAAEEGIDLEIKTYEDYVQPNRALKDGDIDANFFQHLPYLEEEQASKGYKFEHGEGVHIEPYGVYSEKIKDIKDIPEGATIAVTDDPSNQERALKLLEDNNLIKLPKDETATIHNIADNPKNLKFTSVAPPSIPKVLPDYDAGIINGNYALENNLKPSEDAIYLEPGEGNPYANILVWSSDASGEKLEAIERLEKLLHSDELSSYIKEHYSDGEIIPAF
ncbi:MAG: MetQ/NlpA family ABC transporter substrate-binding protein [Actinomycetaceae bacterium]|nr:MetQ/NlpA family ABC transporter substrate-binding protein [Actinomycetaceae bacterium]